MFKDPTKSKVKSKSEKSPWDFTAPEYDERSSCYINAGTHYGVGHKHPIGTEKHSGTYAVPVGKVATEKTDDIPRKNLKIETRD